jgi:hypothetical protein
MVSAEDESTKIAQRFFPRKQACVQDSGHGYSMRTYLLQVCGRERGNVGYLMVLCFSECVQTYLKKVGNECAQCKVLITGKSLNRNASFSTMVQCVGKLRSLIEQKIAETSRVVDDQTRTLVSVLGSVVAEEADPVLPVMPSMIADSPLVKEQKMPRVLVATGSESPLPKPAKKTKVKMASNPMVSGAGTVGLSTAPSLSSLPSHARIGLVLTGLSEDQRATLQENLGALVKLNSGLPVEVERDFSQARTTHIVCACGRRARCPRTLKYLLGVASKAWIVSFEWILESLSAGKLLPEADFMVIGDEAVQMDTFACERSRGDSGRLLEGKEVLFAGPFNAAGPSKADLALLVKTAGGKVVVKTSSTLSQSATIVLSNNMKGPKEGERPYTWLFDSISHYRVID